MKNIIVGFLCLIVHSFCHAQISAGIVAGYTSSNFMRYGEAPLNDYGVENSGISSFHAGVQTEIRLGKKIFLQPSLLYFNNGSRFVGSSIYPGYTGSTYATLRISNLRLPVNLLGKIKIGQTIYLLTGAGLYISRGLSGTHKGNSIAVTPGGGAVTYPIDDKVVFTNSQDYPGANKIAVKPYEFGGNVLLGIEWKHFQLSANLSSSLSNPYTNSGFKYRAVAFFASAAYLMPLKY